MSKYMWVITMNGKPATEGEINVFFRYWIQFEESDSFIREECRLYNIGQRYYGEDEVDNPDPAFIATKTKRKLVEKFVEEFGLISWKKRPKRFSCIKIYYQ